MQIKRTWPCFYNGKTYGIGDTVDVPDATALCWIVAGQAVACYAKETEKKAAEAKEDTAADSLYSAETFKALGWDKAREVAGAMYDVHAAGWDELIAKFLEAQSLRYFPEGEG